jgi:signal transduction histidine kinase
MKIKNKALKKIWSLIEAYPIIVAAIIIYLYYLLASVNMFKHQGEHQTVLDYIMDYDSLFFMWLAAAALIQIQRIRKSFKVEEDRRHQVENVLMRQKIYNQLVNDITLLLQDNVNNPLAVIAVTTQEMRRKFETDSEILHWLDRIDGAMQRIHNTIRDIQAYESQKLIDSTLELVENSTGKNQSTTTDPGKQKSPQ